MKEHKSVVCVKPWCVILLCENLYLWSRRDGESMSGKVYGVKTHLDIIFFKGRGVCGQCTRWRSVSQSHAEKAAYPHHPGTAGPTGQSFCRAVNLGCAS